MNQLPVIPRAGSPVAMDDLLRAESAIAQQVAVTDDLALLQEWHDQAEALAHARGGVKGLLNGAAKRRLTTGNSLPICVAAEAVDIINRHRKGKKLPSWWSVAA